MKLSEEDILGIDYGWVVRHFEDGKQVVSGPMQERTAKRLVLMFQCQATEVEDGSYFEWLTSDDVIECEVEDQCEQWWVSLPKKDSRRIIFNYLSAAPGWEEREFAERYGIENPRMFWAKFQTEAAMIYKLMCEDWKDRAIKSVLHDLGDTPGLENEIAFQQHEAELNTYPN